MKITMYSSDGCANCDMAQKSLEMQGHEVTVLKLGVDYDVQFIMDNFKARSVPQFAVDRMIIKGGIDGIMNYIRGNS